jgi:hypothetical protein
LSYIEIWLLTKISNPPEKTIELHTTKLNIALISLILLKIITYEPH